MTIKIFRIIFLISTSLLFIACGDDSDDSSSSTSYNATYNFDDREKRYLHNLLQTEYLWYDQVASAVNYSSYSSSQEMIDDLKYSTLDLWSYSQTYKEYTDSANQVTQGYGCYYSGSTIKYMRYDSPCDTSGLKRGDTILKIDGETVSSSNYSAAQNDLNQQYTFTIDRNGTTMDVNMTAIEYNYSSSKYQILTRSNGTKVGHFIYNGFTSSSSDEIETAFTYFKNNSISELIIDLRYNGGGSVAIASVLMDKIAGHNEDQIQAHLKWNANNSNEDSYYRFTNDDNTLNISRVIFITTDSTASASEMVINGLKPFMDVVLVGSTTYGKPVGMRGRVSGDTSDDAVIYWLINFSNVNANGEGDYYDGIDVTCEATDQYLYERTNENDNLLAGALHYIDNGVCK